MSVVTNTGPLIALAKINRLDLLQQLFAVIHIPPIVHRELLAKISIETARLEQALTDFIHVSETPDFPPEVRIVTARLDLGEQHAVALAFQLNKLLVVDDKLGRSAAQRLDVPVTGTAGVLLQAKKIKLIDEISPLLQMIQQNGYWLSDELIETVVKMANEDTHQ